MEFGMAVSYISRGLKGFGVDGRNPRLAPPFQSIDFNKFYYPQVYLRTTLLTNLLSH
jgi:hypothetical protein